MKKTLAFALCTLLLAAQAAAQDNPLKVGSILTLTGPWAEFGIAQQNGIRLAQEQHPDMFKHIKFIIEDCAHQGPLTVSAYNKLRALEKVNIVHAWGVAPVEAIAPLAETDHMPFLASAQVARAAAGRRFVIRTINYSEQYSRKLLEHLRSRGISHVGLVQVQMSYYDLLVEGLRKNMTADEHAETIENVSPTESDFRTIALKARRSGYADLGNFLTPPQILAFISASVEINFAPRYFGMHSLHSRELIRKAGGRLEGAIYPNNIAGDEFAGAYLARFGNDDQLPWAANAYDTAMLIAALFPKGAEERLSPELILERLSAPREENGAGGRFIFRDSPETGKYFEYPLGIYGVEGTKPRLLSAD